MVHAQFRLRAVRRLHRGASERAFRGLQRLDGAFDELQLARGFQFTHARHGSRRCAELGATMDERDTGRLASKVQSPVERGVATATNNQVLAVVLLRIAHAVVHLLAFEGLHAVHHEPTRLKRTDTTRDDDSTRIELRAGAGDDLEAATAFATLHFHHFLAQVKLRVERLALLNEAIHQFLRTAHGQRGNVVDGLVRVELRALAAGGLQRVDEVGLHAQQPEFEDLEQPAGASADDDGFGDDDSAHGRRPQ